MIFVCPTSYIGPRNCSGRTFILREGRVVRGTKQPVVWNIWELGTMFEGVMERMATLDWAKEIINVSSEEIKEQSHTVLIQLPRKYWMMPPSEQKKKQKAPATTTKQATTATLMDGI